MADINEDREHIGSIVNAAFTRAEVEEAETLVRAWDAAHPETPSHHYDLGHSLPRTREYLLLREEQSRRMQLSFQEHQERERLLRAARDTQRLEDYAPIRASLHEWLRAHPDDPLIPSVLESAAREETLARDLQAALNATAPENVPLPDGDSPHAPVPIPCRQRRILK